MNNCYNTCLFCCKTYGLLVVLSNRSIKYLLTFPSKIINVLDLACGKGAVSVKLASKFGYNVTGIDAMPEFIDDAIKYAQKYKVENLCKFIVDDILDYSQILHSFDAVIL